MSKAVTIVVPVYADWASLEKCIESLIEFTDLKKPKVVLVNDSGPEADALEKQIKKVTNGNKGFEYFRNPNNLGFLGTCNRAALELDKSDNDILLLNSDTEVTEGWLEEMAAVLAESERHGAVSPRTNNATLATIPLWSVHQKGIDPKESCQIFNKVKSALPRFQEAPVAHGFCMLIRRSLIDEYGLFDEVFGKGYGEEVDFCMRIRAEGYKCLISNRSYVYHLEARSFTPKVKEKLIEEHNQIIWKRYPDYRQEVREYIEQAIGDENKVLAAAGLETPKSKKAGTLRRIVRKLRG